MCSSSNNLSIVAVLAFIITKLVPLVQYLYSYKILLQTKTTGEVFFKDTAATNIAEFLPIEDCVNVFS